jgi:hypothetical protein
VQPIKTAKNKAFGPDLTRLIENLSTEKGPKFIGFFAVYLLDILRIGDKLVKLLCGGP